MWIVKAICQGQAKVLKVGDMQEVVELMKFAFTSRLTSERTWCHQACQHDLVRCTCDFLPCVDVDPWHAKLRSRLVAAADEGHKVVVLI